MGRVNASRDKLNILTCPTHERYESNLCKTGHNFFAVRSDKFHIKSWNDTYAKRPDNYQLIDFENIDDISFDLVLIQHKFGQYQLLKPIAERLHLPSIVLEHTLPMPSWGEEKLKSLKAMKGEMNVFISKYSRKEWGWADYEAQVLEHGIDTELFSNSIPQESRFNIGLSVVNDWINRDHVCGYTVWRNATRGLPTWVLGDTPGLSSPAKDTDDLVSYYNKSKIFINTSTISPVPTSLMEAMACGCAVISLNNCMIPDVVKDGQNGFLCNTSDEIRAAFTFLLKNPEVCEVFGNRARKTIESKYNIDKFVSKWNTLLNHTKEIKFVGN